jgi:hypothetical protein
MSHHYSGPNFGFPHGDARLDLTDIYAFPKPGHAGKSILIMNVHPSSSVVPVTPTTREPFAPTGLYELRIDTDGDAVANIVFRMRASSLPRGGQSVALTRTVGPLAAGADVDGDGDGEVILSGAPVSMGPEANVSTNGDFRFFAGWRSDPFFFDTLGALNGLRFTGQDFFRDRDVCSFVIELPNTALGAGPVRLWARTMDGETGRYVQVERGARPQQAVFLPGDQQGDYMAGQPVDDARFIATFAHSLEHAGGYTPEDAKRVAGALLPDLMSYDAMQPASYPRNGRTLSDDAADQFIEILTNGRITSDNVGPHTDLLGEFPYLGPPHAA